MMPAFAVKHEKKEERKKTDKKVFFIYDHNYVPTNTINMCWKHLPKRKICGL